MVNIEEKVVAVIEPQTVVGESELAIQVSDIEEKAEELIVNSNEQYTEAGQFGRMLKNKMAEVTEFFKPMKKAAHDAHKQVCDREKEMLTPLKNAEKVLKKAMGDYMFKKEQERRKAEEEARKLAKEEAEKKLLEAIEMEKNGNEETAQIAFLNAEIADTASRNIVIEERKPKTDGVSSKKDWEITNIDLEKVPTSVLGTLIRPVDTSAVMRLIRASKGTIHIDGITYQETVKMAFRR